MRKKIAVIGSGISGLSAAHYLKNGADITLYEKEKTLGGHSRTLTIQHHSGRTVDVDTGFMVLNKQNYPNLIELFKELDVEIEPTEMSFSASIDDGASEWATKRINSLFTRIESLKGILDIFKFNRKARKFASSQTETIDPSLSLAEFLDELNLSSWFRDCYLLPMGGAIWSSSTDQMMDFPALTFIQFFNNHGLLKVRNRPQWYTPKKKSIDYVSRIEKGLSSVKKGVQISSIRRKKGGVEITTGEEKSLYDEIIFASHPETLLPIIGDLSEEEKEILSLFSRQKNVTYTHSDPTHMPKRKSCWSSWNFLRKESVKTTSVSVTYWMNCLQHLPSDSPIFITLNPVNPIAPETIYDVCEFYHPLFNQNAIVGQKRIDSIQGVNRYWFCGAYLKYGFHEDGIWSTKSLLKKMHAAKK